ncbi:serine hydrolase domain-containing protein [Leifsonia sp. 21MFCrub1.1]|uniref:serine hydrolase domain-containing protein n=1 Tax=Leifsonia sp. 21MFCrub1.1 TaxID=1798223 RepID=UPI0008927F6B|nr:serine hydrolase [Leifsonia sp. 21MFCrub1.1]SEB09350.1 hypothetical protein SAMN04515680_3214 [Leifsonia sp. 21MFCrub1.1]
MTRLTIEQSTTRPPRYPGVAEELDLDSWQDVPHSQWAFAHVSELVPTATIGHRTRADSGVDALTALDGVADLRAMLADSWTDAFLVQRDGRTIAEYYRPGFAPDDRHLLQSVSKSICGILVGTLVDDGLIDVGRTMASYVPELDGSAYGDATVQQVLDMTVAVEYEEEYRNPESHMQAQDRIAGWRPRRDTDPADTYEFLRGLKANGMHGRRFQYCSADTDALAWLVEAVTGERYPVVLAARVWERLRCAQDATITVDPSGFASANGGISCTAADLARVGWLMLGGGTIEGRRVVSEEWVRQTMAGGDRDVARNLLIQREFPRVSYRNQWWSTGNDRGNVYAVGIHGQYIWLDPQTGTVIVKFSSAPDPVSAAGNEIHARLFSGVCAALPR